MMELALYKALTSPTWLVVVIAVLVGFALGAGLGLVDSLLEELSQL